MNFSRGHVGPYSKNFRSPQENLRAHNEHDEIRFISVNRFLFIHLCKLIKSTLIEKGDLMIVSGPGVEHFKTKYFP